MLFLKAYNVYNTIRKQLSSRSLLLLSDASLGINGGTVLKPAWLVVIRRFNLAYVNYLPLAPAAPIAPAAVIPPRGGPPGPPGGGPPGGGPPGGGPGGGPPGGGPPGGGPPGPSEPPGPGGGPPVQQTSLSPDISSGHTEPILPFAPSTQAPITSPTTPPFDERVRPHTSGPTSAGPIPPDLRSPTAAPGTYHRPIDPERFDMATPQQDRAPGPALHQLQPPGTGLHPTGLHEPQGEQHPLQTPVTLAQLQGPDGPEIPLPDRFSRAFAATASRPEPNDREPPQDRGAEPGTPVHALQERIESVSQDWTHAHLLPAIRSALRAASSSGGPIVLALGGQIIRISGEASDWLRRNPEVIAGYAAANYMHYRSLVARAPGPYVRPEWDAQPPLAVDTHTSLPNRQGEMIAEYFLVSFAGMAAAVGVRHFAHDFMIPVMKAFLPYYNTSCIRNEHTCIGQRCRGAAAPPPAFGQCRGSCGHRSEKSCGVRAFFGSRTALGTDAQTSHPKTPRPTAISLSHHTGANTLPTTQVGSPKSPEKCPRMDSRRIFTKQRTSHRKGQAHKNDEREGSHTRPSARHALQRYQQRPRL